MKLIVGLGNPGNKYEHNRHNVGFILLDEYARKSNLNFTNFTKANSLVTQDTDKYLCKPQTFMNNSGEAVLRMSNFYKIAPKDIYIIHDDLDLEFGIVKKQFGRGAAGHHGVEDIISKLGTQDFWRIRVGIGKPQGKIDAYSYVLEDFSENEINVLRNIDLNEYILVEDSSR